MGTEGTAELRPGDWVRLPRKVGHLERGTWGRLRRIDMTNTMFGHFVELSGTGERLGNFARSELEPYTPTEEEIYRWALRELAS